MSDFDEFMETWKEHHKNLPSDVFSAIVTEDEPKQDNLYKTYVPDTGKHSDRIIFTICVGNKEGNNIPHFHLWRGKELKPSQNWGYSLEIQFKKSQYFEELGGIDPLTTKEIKVLVDKLKRSYADSGHTLWEELVQQWNIQNDKTKGDVEHGWLRPNTPMPDYRSGISLYK